MKAVIVLPTYNEQENINTLLNKLIEIVKQIKNYQFFILVVDDNSPDGTGKEVIKFSQKNPQVKIITGQRHGLGAALLRGVKYAIDTLGADIIVQMDADLSHDPEVLPKFFDKFKNGADFVVGSRYIPGGSIPDNWGLHRKIFSVLGNAIVRHGLGFIQVHDWTGGYRAYQSKYFEISARQMSYYKGYVYQIAFLHKAILSGANVDEVAIHFTDRKYGKSKIAPYEYIRNVISYVIKSRLNTIITGTFGKFAVVGTIGFTINTVILELIVHFGQSPVIGSAIGAEIAIISNFILNNFWTFNARKISQNQLFNKFIQFNAASLGAIIIQSSSVWLGTSFISYNLYRIWYIIGVGLGLIWNYYMYSNFIWKKNK